MGLLIGLPVADAFKGRSKDFTKAAEGLGLMLLIAGPGRGAPGAGADRHRCADRRSGPHHARRRRPACIAGDAAPRAAARQPRSDRITASRSAHVCCPSGRTADIAALETLAAVTMPGVHTLPKTREKIAAAVERSIASFAAQVDIPSEESYLFVLENLASGEIVGTAAIYASAGSNGTYFSFRNDVIQQVSRDLNISHSVHALTLCSELTGYSQLSGFYVREREHGRPRGGAAVARAPAVRRAGAAALRRPLLRAAGRRDRRRRRFAVLGCAGPQILQDGFSRRRARHRRRPQPHPDRRADAALPGLRAAAAGRRPGGDGPDPSGRRAGVQPADRRRLRGRRLHRHLRRRPDPAGAQERAAHLQRRRCSARAWSSARPPAASAQGDLCRSPPAPGRISAPSPSTARRWKRASTVALSADARDALQVAVGDSVICVRI